MMARARALDEAVSKLPLRLSKGSAVPASPMDEAPPASPGTMADINAMEAREAGAAPAPAPSS